MNKDQPEEIARPQLETEQELATEQFLKDSFKMIRIQALEQAMQIAKNKIGSGSDPRTLFSLIDDMRKLIEITERNNL